MRRASLLVVAALVILREAAAVLPGAGAPDGLEALPASLQSAFADEAVTDFRFAREEDAEEAVAPEAGASEADEAPEEEEVAEAAEAPEEVADAPEGEKEASKDAPEAPKAAATAAAEEKKPAEEPAASTGAATGATGGVESMPEDEAEPVPEPEPEPEPEDPATLAAKALIDDLDAQVEDEMVTMRVVDELGSGANIAQEARLLHASTGSAHAMDAVLKHIDEMEARIANAQEHHLRHEAAAAGAAEGDESAADALARAKAEAATEGAGEAAAEGRAAEELVRTAESAVEIYGKLKEARKVLVTLLHAAKEASAAAVAAGESGASEEELQMRFAAFRNRTAAAHAQQEAVTKLHARAMELHAEVEKSMAAKDIPRSVPDADAISEDEEEVDPAARAADEAALKAKELSQLADESVDRAEDLAEEGE